MTLEKIKNNSELVNKYNLYLAQVEIYNTLAAKHESERATLTKSQKAEIKQNKQELKQAIEELTTCSEFETTASVGEMAALVELLTNLREEIKEEA